MARQATIIGAKKGKWSSISVGSPAELRPEFKYGDFLGYDSVVYLDTSGGTRRKKGKKAAPKSKASKAKE